MKNQFLAITLFLVSVLHVHSQKSGDNEKANTSSYLTLNPLSILDVHAPRVRAGYVQHLADRWKIGVDLGLGSGTGMFSKHRESENNFLWEVRPELYYILKPEARTLKYLSAEFFYIQQTSTLLNNSYEREDGVNLQYDQADFERQKYGMHLKFGLFLNAGSHWGFNFYGGIGFRFRTTAFTNVLNAIEDSLLEDRHGSFYETIYDAERNDFRPNPSLGVRVFYRL